MLHCIIFHLTRLQTHTHTHTHTNNTPTKTRGAGCTCPISPLPAASHSAEAAFGMSRLAFKLVSSPTIICRNVREDAQVCVCVCVCACVFVCVWMCACMRTYICIYICTCVRMYAYIWFDINLLIVFHKITCSGVCSTLQHSQHNFDLPAACVLQPLAAEFVPIDSSSWAVCQTHSRAYTNIRKCFFM